MAYNKKDEDDAGILKVDRTSVFQEGQQESKKHTQTTHT